MSSLYAITPTSVLNWLTAFCIFEIPLAFFYLSISKPGDYVIKWYSGKSISIWNVIAQDLLYGFCGVIIAAFLFSYLVSKKILKSSYLLFIFVLIAIQWLGDLSFASTMINWPKKYDTKWTKFFKGYIKNSGFNALIGDTIWIVSWALAYYFVVHYIQRFDVKIFIICLFFFLLSAYSVI